jgi:ethanolamine utilization protein EutN
LIIGKIVGNVVCTQKDPTLVGRKMLVVQPVDLKTLETSGSSFVALDGVGAGDTELVMVVGGSSARMADGMSQTPTDRSIIGIIDSIEILGETVFRKDQ